jgi:LPXTG-site transpeptidase (sortase) family protein
MSLGVGLLVFALAALALFPNQFSSLLVPFLARSPAPAYSQTAAGHSSPHLSLDETGGLGPLPSLTPETSASSTATASPTPSPTASPTAETEAEPTVTVAPLSAAATEPPVEPAEPAATYTPRPAPTPTPVPGPGRLAISAIKLDQQTVIVPITDGAWDISELGDSVGWLANTGRMPGDDLAMVFTAHATISALINGPFARLWTIKTGEELVYTWQGTDYVYVVREQWIVAPNDVGQLFVRDGNVLLLVTCNIWSSDGNIFTNRLVVSAELVRVQASSIK